LCVEVERLLQASKWHRHVTCINLSEQHLRADCDIFLFVICASSAKRHGAAWVTTSAEVEAKPMKRPISRRTAAAPRRSGEAWGSSSAAPRPATGRSAAKLATRLGDQRRHGGPLPGTTRDTGKPKAAQTLTARTLQGSAVPRAGWGATPCLLPFGGVRRSQTPVSPGIRAHRLRFTARSRYGVGKTLATLGAGLGFLVHVCPGDPHRPGGVDAGLVLLPRLWVLDVCGPPRAWPAWRPPSGRPPGTIRCWGRRLRGELCGLGAHHFCSRCPFSWHRGWAWREGKPQSTLTTDPAESVVGVCVPSFRYGGLPGARLGAEAARAEEAVGQGAATTARARFGGACAAGRCLRGS
jgi:hypothetical protein